MGRNAEKEKVKEHENKKEVWEWGSVGLDSKEEGDGGRRGLTGLDGVMRRLDASEGAGKDFEAHFEVASPGEGILEGLGLVEEQGRQLLLLVLEGLEGRLGGFGALERGQTRGGSGERRRWGTRLARGDDRKQRRRGKRRGGEEKGGGEEEENKETLQSAKVCGPVGALFEQFIEQNGLAVELRMEGRLLGAKEIDWGR